MFTFVLKHSLSMHCFGVFFSKRCLTVHFTYQGCSTAFIQVWMNVSVCVCVRVCLCDHHWNGYRFLIFSMLLSLSRIDESFYCDDLTLPNRPFFCVCFVAFVLDSPLSWHWFCFVWLLPMSWLNASKSYTNWTIKDILNSEKWLLSFSP